MKKSFLLLLAATLISCFLHRGAYAYTTISAPEAYDMYSNNELVIVDVRESYEYCPGHISCAVNYPLSGTFSEEYHNLPTDAPILVVCAGGSRSAMAARILDNNGYKTVYSLAGGMSNWPYDTVACMDTLSNHSPLNTRYIWNYAPVQSPITASNPAACRPLAIGNLSSGNVRLQVGLPAFSPGIDVYLAIGFSGSLYLVDGGNALRPLSVLTELPRWKTNISTDICELLYGDIPISFLAPGTYNLYLLVAPTEETGFNHYYLWSTFLYVRQ